MFLRHPDSVRPHLQERHPWQSFSVFEPCSMLKKSTAGSGTVSEQEINGYTKDG